MYTYGNLVVSEGHKENARIVDVWNQNGNGTHKQVSLKYTEKIPNHYKFRGVVDDHNKKRTVETVAMGCP